MNLFITTVLDDPFTYFSWVVVVAFSICLHEYAHAHMAWKMGDDTAALLGHLTMNPMIQMGPRSILMLLLIGIAWGAVPVNVARIRTRAGAAMVSFAGPAANLLLSLIFGAVTAGLVMLAGGASETVIIRFMQTGCVANGVLFFFNMLPVPMLDGWSVFALFIPAMRSVHPQQARNITWVFFLLVFLTPVGSMVWSIGGGMARFIVGAWMSLFALLG